MDWQETVALLITAGTAGLFVWSRIRRRKFRLHKDTHCGCSSTGSPAAGRIIFHARKGEQGQILVKAR